MTIHQIANKMTIQEAVDNGISRIRRPEWNNLLTYLKLDIIEGKLGPWVHLYARMEQEVMNQETPTSMLCLGYNTTTDTSWVAYAGPLDEGG